MKAAKTNKKKNGEDFYRFLGFLGGIAPKKKPGGFGSDVLGADGLTGKQRAVVAGAVGGKVSKRGPAVSKQDRMNIKPQVGGEEWKRFRQSEAEAKDQEEFRERLQKIDYKNKKANWARFNEWSKDVVKKYGKQP